MRTLYTLPYSPWSEKARWALDHHGLAYRDVKFLPVLGVPALRLRVGFGKKLSIPTLLEDDGSSYIDSFVIAQHAEATGQGARLFSEAQLDAIAAWNEKSETLISLGRELFMVRLNEDKEAQLETMPKLLQVFRGLSIAIANSYIRNKYGLNGNPREEQLALVKSGFDELRAALGGKDYLLGGAFSYADVAMAAALQFFAPLDVRWRPLGPGLVRITTVPEVVSEYADLVAWRDRMYERHRALPAA